MLLLGLLLACSKPPPPTVVLISSDTTRADAISAWTELTWRPELPADQRPAPRTPNIDALATRGTRFALALAQAPTTLSSHATVLSGHDPHGHRVVRNGYPVPDDVPLLAERLQAAGWDTLAAVAAAPLDARTGLSRGFRLYADHVQSAAPGSAVAPGPRVTDAALQAVDQRQPDAPLFLFVHYYDPHMPWTTADAELRAAFVDPAYTGPVTGAATDVGLLTRATVTGRLSDADARQARALYLAEVAVVDREVDRLLDGLEQRGLLGNSLVVFLADHGEALDEHATTRPWGHGHDVDLVATHVPLVMAGRGELGRGVPAGQVVGRQVRLQDVAPTVLGLLGLPPIGTGEDLGPLLRGEQPEAPPAFAEATAPAEAQDDEAWNNRPMERGIALHGQLLVHSPLQNDQRALYDLAPGQPRATDKSRARVLIEELDAWSDAAPPHRDVVLEPATEEALRALGYVE